MCVCTHVCMFRCVDTFIMHVYVHTHMRVFVYLYYPHTVRIYQLKKVLISIVESGETL